MSLNTNLLDNLNLIGCWPLNDGQGKVVKDTGPKNASGTINGNVQWTDGYLEFDGASSITCGTAPSLGGTGPFTVSAWIKTTHTERAVIVQQRDSREYNGEYVLAIRPGGTPSFWLFGDGHEQFRLEPNIQVADGKWHHLVGVRDGDHGRLYVDGEEFASHSSPACNLNSSIAVGIGADIRDNNGYFKGTISQVRIYQNALTAEQIRELACQRPDDRYAVATPVSNRLSVIGTEGLLCTADGRVYQTLLGPRSFPGEFAPLPVGGVTDAFAVTALNFVLRRIDNGTVWTFSANELSRVQGIDRVVSIDTSFAWDAQVPSHPVLLCLREDGTVWTKAANESKFVQRFSGAKAIAGGRDQYLVLHDDGSVTHVTRTPFPGWGQFLFGRNRKFVDIAASRSILDPRIADYASLVPHWCAALDEDGRIWVLGRGAGCGDSPDAYTPVPVNSNVKFRSIRAGDDQHSRLWAISETGQVYRYGTELTQFPPSVTTAGRHVLTESGELWVQSEGKYLDTASFSYVDFPVPTPLPLRA